MIRQFYLMPIKTAGDIPTTNPADSNGYLDERIVVQLRLKVLPAGTLSLKSPCQLPVDVLRYVCLHCNVHMSCILYFFWLARLWLVWLSVCTNVL